MSERDVAGGGDGGSGAGNPEVLSASEMAAIAQVYQALAPRVLRDFFAGCALVGLRANSGRHGMAAWEDAKAAFDAADAMMERWRHDDVGVKVQAEIDAADDRKVREDEAADRLKIAQALELALCFVVMQPESLERTRDMRTIRDAAAIVARASRRDQGAAPIGGAS